VRDIKVMARRFSFFEALFLQYMIL